MRKTNFEQLLALRPDGITVAPFERGEIDPDLFRAACRMGLEGLVSKRRDWLYRGGRQKFWIKVEEPATSCDGAGALELAFGLGASEVPSQVNSSHKIGKLLAKLCSGPAGIFIQTYGAIFSRTPN